MKIYCGNLSYTMTDEELNETFSAFGNVSKANVVMDRETRRSKGFGFVEMDDDQQAQEAIEQLNGSNVGGRNLNVNEARPREDRPRH